LSEFVSKYTVDASDGYRELEQLEQHAAMTAKTVHRVVQTGYTTVYLMLDILGQTLPLALQLAAQAVIQVSMAWMLIAQAEGLNPLTMVQAAIHFSLATLMFYRALQIQSKASEIEDNLNKGMRILRLYI
jgi:hypothetical protein